MKQTTDLELIQAVDRFFKRQRLMRQKQAIEEQIYGTEQLIAELTEKAQLELDDVEILKREGLPRLFISFQGKLEERIEREEKEFNAAFSKLKKGHESLEILEDKRNQLVTELEQFADASNSLEILALHPPPLGEDHQLNEAISTAQTLLLIREFEEKMAAAEQAEIDVRHAQSEDQRGMKKKSIEYMHKAHENLDFCAPSLNPKLSRILRILKSDLNKPNRAYPEPTLLEQTVDLFVGNNTLTNQPNECLGMRDFEQLRREILSKIKTLKKEHAKSVERLVTLEKVWNG